MNKGASYSRWLSFVFTLTFILAGIGSILQISGGNWDVTSHLLLNPESFFTPSHAILYSGVFILIVSSILGLFLMLRYREARQSTLCLPLRLLIIGSSLSLIAGPGDYLWHQTFGVDGFLSPTHLLLITGMLVNSFGSAIGLFRIKGFMHHTFVMTLSKVFLVLAFISLWLNMISYVYIFALPISNGELFNFNLNPIIESLIAIIFLPIVYSLAAFSIVKTFNRFGYLTLIGLGVVSITALTNIVPSDELAKFLPFYLLSILPFFIIDIIFYKRTISSIYNLSQKSKMVIASSVIASLYYIIGYPWLPLALGNYLMPINLEAVGFTNLADILPIFITSLFVVLPITIVTGALVGAVVALSSSKINGASLKRMHTSIR